MVGSLDQALDMKRRPQKGELTDYDRKLIGTFVRLEIPLTDLYKLREVAEHLRGFADKIDHLTRRQDLTVRGILMELKMEASLTATKIKKRFPEVFERRFTGHQSHD